MTANGPRAGEEKRPLDRLIENPLALLQLSCTVLLAGSAAAALIAWIFGAGYESVRIPLLVMGFSVISLIVTLNQGWLGASLGVAIVGILVAPRDYMLRVTHMLSGSDAPFEQYATRYEGEGVVGSSRDDHVMEQMLDVLEQAGVVLADSTRRDLSRVISAEEVERVAGAVLRDGSDYPLQRVVEGGDALRTLVSENRGEAYFEADMAFLRREGLISFPGLDYLRAVPTDLGRRVAGHLERSLPTPPSDQDFESNRPPVNRMTQVGIDAGPVQAVFPEGRSPVWFRFTVAEEAQLRIDVQSSDGDPLARLYGPGDFIFLAEDDDTGPVLDSRIDELLSPGTYYLGVRNLYLGPDPLQVTIRTLP